MFSMFEIEVDAGRESAGVFGRQHLAAVLGQQRGVAVEVEDVGELHEPQVAVRLAVGQGRLGLRPNR